MGDIPEVQVAASSRAIALPKDLASAAAGPAAPGAESVSVDGRSGRWAKRGAAALGSAVGGEGSIGGGVGSTGAEWGQPDVKRRRAGAGPSVSASASVSVGMGSAAVAAVGASQRTALQGTDQGDSAHLITAAVSRLTTAPSGFPTVPPSRMGSSAALAIPLQSALPSAVVRASVPARLVPQALAQAEAPHNAEPFWPRTSKVPAGGAWNKTLVLHDGSVVHPFVVL